jgi:hypothetical protein
MQSQLVAVLIVASWAHQGEDERQLPVAAREVQVIRVLIPDNRNGNLRIGANRQAREITLEMPAPPAPAEEDDEPRPARPARPALGLNINTAVVGRENFDRWLFGEPNIVDRERHLEDILLTRVRTAVREHGLTERQKAKLQLAGRGDIKRFLDRVEDRRRDFEKDRQRFQTGLAALRRLDDLSQIYQTGPFGDGSLFAKTLQKIKDDLTNRQAGS